MYDDLHAVVSQFLHAPTDVVDQGIRNLLDDVVKSLDGAVGSVVLSTWRSSPQRPICSAGEWNEAQLQNTERLREIAALLHNIEKFQCFTKVDQSADALNWIRSLLTNESNELVVLPLRGFLPKETSDSPALKYALVTAFKPGKAGGKEHRQALVEYARFLAVILMARECPRLMDRTRKLAKAFLKGVNQLLNEPREPVGPAYRDTHWGQLVSDIQNLMECDTCQLYLLPQFADLQKDQDKIWLVAESAACRHSLRYYRNENALTSYLWREHATHPLRIRDLPNDPVYRLRKKGKFGHARHFLGAVLRDARLDPLGIITLRDKFENDPSTGQSRINNAGFSDEDEIAFTERVSRLSAFIEDNRGNLTKSELHSEIDAKLENIRESFSADTCLLLITPETIGKKKDGDADYIELYSVQRRNWLHEANYVKGEGLTGKVWELGESINEQDVLDSLRRHQGNGKYRLSQHCLGVPIRGPGVQPRGASQPIIGVLKVRDRLEAGELTDRGFSDEDRHLLEAFADMISARLAFRQVLEEKETLSRAQLDGVGSAVYHDVRNIIRPNLNLELPENVRLRLLKRALTFTDRFNVALNVYLRRYQNDGNPKCSLGAVVRYMLPPGSDGKSPDPTHCGLYFTVSSSSAPIKPGLRVYCNPRLAELTLLAVPAMLCEGTTQQASAHFTVSCAEAGEKVVLDFLCTNCNTIDPRRSNHVEGRALVYTNVLISPLLLWASLSAALETHGARLEYAPDGNMKCARVFFDAARRHNVALSIDGAQA